MLRADTVPTHRKAHSLTMKTMKYMKRTVDGCRARLLLLAIMTGVVLLTAVTTLHVCSVSSAQTMVRLKASVKYAGTLDSSSTGSTSSQPEVAGAPDPSKEQGQPPAAAFKTPAAGNPLPTAKHASQLDQDKLIDELLHGMTGGFFVESGAHDGTSLSNTVFLEANRNWTGLLVEANPQLFEMLMSSSNRTASRAINACLSPSGKREVLDFALGGFLGGLTGYMSEAHDHRMKSEIKAAGDAAGPTNTGKTVSVTCWPLHEMMAALGKARVDYWR